MLNSEYKGKRSEVKVIAEHVIVQSVCQLDGIAVFNIDRIA